MYNIEHEGECCDVLRCRWPVWSGPAAAYWWRRWETSCMEAGHRLGEYLIRYFIVNVTTTGKELYVYIYRHAHTHTHTHTQTHTTILLLSRFYPGQPGWASSRRNIHPLTHIVVIDHPLSASSIYYDLWHPLCSIYVHDSLSTISLQVFFGLEIDWMSVHWHSKNIVNFEIKVGVYEKVANSDFTKKSCLAATVMRG